ncbi:MAG: GerAB/ArcD/ProY family transporter [bacterium]|nr:GerAB/ArcD/ProY family transporter [bacterium]
MSKTDDNWNILDLNKNLFGKIIGTILNYIIAIIFLIISISSMYNLINFIVSQFLAETPILIIGILFSIVIFYAVYKGFEVISRISIIFFVINLTLFIIAISGLISEIDISNIKPILEYGLKNPFISSLQICSINLLPVFLLLIFKRNDIIDKEKYNKYLFIYMIICNILLLSFIGVTTLILGNNLISAYQYPEFIVLKKVKLFGFLDRIENVVSIQWILGLFMSLVLTTYYITTTIHHNKKNKKTTISIIIIIILLTSIYAFKNNTIFNYYSYHYYPYITGSLFIIFLIVLIRCFIHKKRIKS